MQKYNRFKKIRQNNRNGISSIKKEQQLIHHPSTIGGNYRTNVFNTCYNICKNGNKLINRFGNEEWIIKIGILPLYIADEVIYVPIFIHYVWIFFILTSFLNAVRFSLINGFLVIILTGPILLLSLMIHEIGHASMTLYLNGNSEKVILWPLGGLSQNITHNSFCYEMLIAISGPLTHIPQFLFWTSLLYLSNNRKYELLWKLESGGNFWVNLCSGSIIIQIILLVFNLLPVYPLDGGKILSIGLKYLNFESNLVYKITALVGGVSDYLYLNISNNITIQNSLLL